MLGTTETQRVEPRAFTADHIHASSSLAWIRENRINLDGKPVDLDSHIYQIAPLIEDQPRQCAMKGAQVGWTSVSMLRAIHGLSYGKYPQGVLYLFPTREDVTDFSKGRFNPLIADNPAIAAYVKDTDAANIKRIGNSMLYMRGARSTRSIQGSKKTATQLKSVPVDLIVFDEYDEMEPAMIDMAVERLSHSSVKEEFYLSTPSIPDYGIDALYQHSDQRVWMIKCQGCGHETCLELSFPACLIDQGDGQVIRACMNCHREIHPRAGHWVAQFPSRSKDLVGWWISQLNSMFVEPTKILSLFNNPPGGRLQEVYNSKLGKAYIEAANRLSIQDVISLCGSDGIANLDPGPCFMGVDQGKDLHVVIGRMTTDSKFASQLLHIEVYREWEQLDSLMKAFNVLRCVVDALPETRNARSFAGRFPGKVYLNYYNENQKGSYAWNEKELTVSCNRTESLDASHNQITEKTIALPKECQITNEFAVQLHNVAKRLEEDDETGSKRYVYVKLGTDHFRHAFNYECMARSIVEKALFPWAFNR